MALSSTTKCELYQEDSIKWRCIDCDRSMCDKCKKIHLRIPATARHKIISIGSLHPEVQNKIGIDNIPCKNHPEKVTSLVCRVCNSLICQDCVSSSHKNHSLDSIETVHDYFSGIYNMIDEKLQYCDYKTSELQDIKPKYNSVFNDSLKKIKQKEQELIDTIRRHSKILQERLEINSSKVKGILQQIEKDIENTKRHLKELKNEIDTALTTVQCDNIFRATMKVKDHKFDNFPNQVEQFIPEEDPIEITEEMFGSLHKLCIPTTRGIPELEVEVIRTFTTDLPYIDLVVTLDETSAWVACHAKHVLQKVNIQDNSITTSQELSMKVFHMAVTPNNELLLSMYKGSEIKLLKTSGEMVSFLTVAPLLSKGIYVTKDNDVLVGVVEPGTSTVSKPTNQRQRAIIVFGIEGKQRYMYQYDNDGQRLFTVAKRIITNNNKDILVVDRTSNYTGRVVVLNKKGDFRWSYEGHYKFNSSKQFDPRGIATTSVGHIIVSDFINQALHILSEDGEILTCQVIRDVGVAWPWGFDIDKEGRLWLGCDTDDGDTEGKLHVIKLASYPSIIRQLNVFI